MLGMARIDSVLSVVMPLVYTVAVGAIGFGLGRAAAFLRLRAAKNTIEDVREHLCFAINYCEGIEYLDDETRAAIHNAHDLCCGEGLPVTREP